MDSSEKTRNMFLIGISLVYMFAFGSIYSQIPGLYGRSGILPVGTLMQSIKDESNLKNAESLFFKTPSLLWFMSNEPEAGLEILSILGLALSFFMLVWKKLRTSYMFFFLWLIYLSIYKVGETFMWFQWDILLLEVGFITVWVAPFCNKTSTAASLRREVSFYLVKWLLFRLMFASGVVKLTSRCPTWWSLTALKYHYESQCIPTPLAWWAHQLPDSIGQLSVIVTYVIEIFLPFFFFLPFRIPRLFAAYGQVILMIAIYLSGNYNFFNIITVVLCLSLVDDRHLEYVQYLLSLGHCKPPASPVTKSRTIKFIKFCLNLSCFVAFFYIISRLFEYRNGTYKIKFSQTALQSYLTWGMPYIVWMAALSFGAVSVKVLYRTLIAERQGFCKWISSCCKFFIVTFISIYLLSISVVRFSDVDPNFKPDIWPIANKWYQTTSKFDLVHSYGLFRRMTGVGGRPEVVLEGSDSSTGQWKEYHFVYKPGSLNGSLPWAAPHQPRLDWQMWFAALGSYQHNPWLISFMHRLLLGQDEVLDLMDRSKNPFPKTPPKYVRAVLYHYHYTGLGKNFKVPANVWRRKFKSEYVPAIQKDDAQVLEFLKYNKLLPRTKKADRKSKSRRYSESFTKSFRKIVTKMAPEKFLWSLAISALLIFFVSTKFTKRNE